MMKTSIPDNNVSVNYNGVLNNFVELIKQRQKDNIISIFLTGSFARGEATNTSDLDVWCIFQQIDDNVLYNIGSIIQELPLSYNQLELNAQCLTVKELISDYFSNFMAKPIIIFEGILLFGDDIVGNDISKLETEKIYKSFLAEILLSIRHYICVNEPVENLTYHKIKVYILKPLMFALRLEHYCNCDKYPLTNLELLNSYSNGVERLVQYFIDPKSFEKDITINHKKVLSTMHNLVSKLII